MNGTFSTHTLPMTANHSVGADFGLPKGGNIHGFVQSVLRDSYLEMLEDLAFYAAKVRHYNAMKDAIRKRLTDYRQVMSKLAGLKDEDPINQNPQAPGSSTSPGSAPSVSANQVVIESAEQRASEHPEAHVSVSEFLGYQYGNGRTRLEDLVIRDSAARDRLVQAIPYMTSGELAQVLFALGGTDMKLAGSIKGLWSQISEAMTPQQALDLGAMIEANPGHRFFGWYSNPLRDPDFFRVFESTLKRSRALAETRLGVSPGASAAELADGFREHVRQAQAAEQARAAAEAQAQSQAAASSEQGTNDPAPVFDADLDLDRSDGVIDGVMVIDEPPYVVKSGESITTKAELEAAIQALEEKLSSVGDDAQLANVDLQNALQKQQHLLQLMSNVSKIMHDTNMAIIRKIG